MYFYADDDLDISVLFLREFFFFFLRTDLNHLCIRIAASILMELYEEYILS